MDITAAIAGLTERTVRYRLARRMGELDVNRLEEKLKLAGGVAARQSAKIEARADALIAREPLIEAKTDEAFSPHETILNGQETALDTLEHMLAAVSNDPLGSSSSQSGGSAASTEPSPN